MYADLLRGTGGRMRRLFRVDKVLVTVNDKVEKTRMTIKRKDNARSKQIIRRATRVVRRVVRGKSIE